MRAHVLLPFHAHRSSEAARRSRLPSSTTALVGRATDISAVCKTLRDPDVRLLTLTGVAGIGKTRVAIAAADQLHDDSPDGIVFVELAPVSDPESLPAVILSGSGAG